MTAKTALITGITGQDIPYLAEQLLDNGYQARRVARRASTFHAQRIDSLHGDSHTPDTRLFFHHCDLTHATRLIDLLEKVRPDEVYHCRRRPHHRQTALGRFPTAQGGDAVTSGSVVDRRVEHRHENGLRITAATAVMSGNSRTVLAVPTRRDGRIPV